LVLTLTLCTLAALGCGSSGRVAEQTSFADGADGAYIALGDSVAAGSGASDAETTSYVALIAEALRERGAKIELVSLAAGGSTTQSLIDGQLPAALERIGQGGVALVTLTIAGNDLGQYAAHEACVTNPVAADCPLEDGLLEVEERLDRILGDLRAAAPDTPIVIELYPNLFAGTGHPLTYQADVAFGLLNGVIESVAGRHGVLLADPRNEFETDGGRLTHLLDDMPDAHPNDAGHRAIAEAFLRALGLRE
jgi:lysophospholipase L1-like esterase